MSQAIVALLLILSTAKAIASNAIEIYGAVEVSDLPNITCIDVMREAADFNSHLERLVRPGGPFVTTYGWSCDRDPGYDGIRRASIAFLVSGEKKLSKADLEIIRTAKFYGRKASFSSVDEIRVLYSSVILIFPLTGNIKEFRFTKAQTAKGSLFETDEAVMTDSQRLQFSDYYSMPELMKKWYGPAANDLEIEMQDSQNILLVLIESRFIIEIPKPFEPGRKRIQFLDKKLKP